MADVVMPRLSDSMEEGTIVTWHVSPGDAVEVGQEIVEIETDKATMGYEAAVAGTLDEILAKEGETLPVGATIARIAVPGEPAPAPAAATERRSAPRARAAAASGVRATPLARRIAGEKGLDLGEIAGSGPGGRIVSDDVRSLDKPAAAPPRSVAEGGAGPEAKAETAKGEVTVEEPSKAQQLVARRMSEAKATAPHFYLTAEVAMTEAVDARALLKGGAREGDVVPSFNDMVVKACAIALREQPKANGSYRDGRFESYSRVNVGVAVATAGNLLVPTVFDADRKGLRRIAEETRALAAKVRDGSITPPELAGGTFSVSNLGMFGVDAFAAVVNPPQAGILAVGAIRETPVVRDGSLVVGHLMTVTLSCDHRVLYGAEGAQLLARVKALLERPLGLAL